MVKLCINRMSSSFVQILYMLCSIQEWGRNVFGDEGGTTTVQSHDDNFTGQIWLVLKYDLEIHHTGYGSSSYIYQFSSSLDL